MAKLDFRHICYLRQIFSHLLQIRIFIKMDIILQRIGTHKLERIFPIDNRTEERTRKAGLNLWYVIHFDEDTNLEQVAKDLSQVADVAKVQFSHIIQRSYDPNVRATVLHNLHQPPLQQVLPCHPCHSCLHSEE